MRWNRSDLPDRRGLGDDSNPGVTHSAVRRLSSARTTRVKGRTENHRVWEDGTTTHAMRTVNSAREDRHRSGPLLLRSFGQPLSNILHGVQRSCGPAETTAGNFG